MARCYICHKGTLKGYKVSHSAVKTRRFFKPNLHKLRMQAKNKKIVIQSICSKCYKKIKNDFGKGIKHPLIPISILNQTKYIPTSAKATAGIPTSKKATAGIPTSKKATAGIPTSKKATAGIPTSKLKVMPVLPSIHDKVGTKKDNG